MQERSVLPPVTTQPGLGPGSVLGDRYELGPEVGRGGMAVVHRARDRVLDRDVAVKLLHPHLAGDPAFLDRFRQEARAAAGLAHPNIVAVHDWGEHPDGAFLVLQLVEGASLREVLRHRGRLSPEEAGAILIPAAAGLEAAHRAGIVHRDVKPENLLIGRDGTVRVTDFGLARAAAHATATFGPEVLVGSPHYLAPEAVEGRSLDARADVYALGIVLYECLTGRPPHLADTPYSTALAHLQRDVPAPSEEVGAVPEQVDAVVLRATRRDPSARTDSAAEVAAGLRAAVGALVAVPSAPPAEDRDATGAAAPTPPLGTSSAPVPGRTLVVPVADHHTEVVGPPVDGGKPSRPDGRRDDQPPPPPPRAGRRRWPLVLALLVLLVGGSAVGGYLLWDRVLAPVTPIPSVLGAPEASAVEQLERAGFVVEVEDAVHDLGVPAGAVLGQQPMGEARTGTTVSLVPSAGPRRIEVPSLAGEEAGTAAATLRELGLRPDSTSLHHEQVPEGRVIGTDPGGGEVVDEGSEVVVTVSLGPTPIPVPELAGRPLSEVRQMVVDAGLVLEILERRYDADVPRDVVLAQEPEPEVVMIAGDTVGVVVSDGPAPVTIPNVRTERVADAVATLEALGLQVEVERRGGFSAWLNPDRVYDQDPGPGSTRLPGEVVVLFAYDG